jgi:Ca-activated chloride channel family protein
MTFGAPWMLAGIPVVLLLHTVASAVLLRRKHRLARMFPAAHRDQIRQAPAPDLLVLRILLAAAGLSLCAFALARPQWGYTWRDAQREGLDLVVAIDTSNSMRADDFSPTRLQRAKWGVEDLVKTLKGDRVGLVAFAGEGVLQCPMTLDYGAFLMHLQDLFPGIVPRGGTDLEAALRTALDHLEENTEADQVVLLITDGENHTGNLDAVIGDLRKRGIRVFAIGVGTPEGSLIPLSSQSGDFLKNRREEVVKSSLDEAVLKRISSETGGLYVRATPQDFGATAVVEEGLAPLKRAQLENQRIQEMEERYQIFLGAGLFLLLLERFARVPAMLWKRRGTA